ncbi:MAG: hypothetical protein MJ175_06830 [Clostridia bacterium]|nr:hypothetical protein [Clostridia bacterium]
MKGQNLKTQVVFTVDGNSTTGKTITNKVAMMNQWDYARAFLGEQDKTFFAKQFPFVEYIQFMTATGGSLSRDLFLDPRDRSVTDDYNFSRLIEACRNVVEQGSVKPFLKTGAVPVKYSASAPISADFGVNLQKPDDYRVYHRYIAAAAKALVDAFGLDEVRTWKWGVLTEYENKSWFDCGSPEETAEAYFCLYDYTVDALESVLGEDIFIGAHSMTCSEGLWDERLFIRHCAEGVNRCTGKRGTRLCYLASSFYDITPNQAAETTLTDSIDILRSCAEECGLHGLRYGVDEGRILNGCDNLPLTSRITGHTSQAAYDAMTIKTMIDHDIDYFCAWNYLTGDAFHGLKTVSYHTADCFSRMISTELIRADAESSGLPRADIRPEIVASRDTATGKIFIMAYHFVRDMLYDEKISTGFDVAVPGNADEVRVTRWLVDDTANFFEKWYEEAKKLPNTTGWSVDSAGIILPFRAEDYEPYSHLVPTEEICTLTDRVLHLNLNLQCGGVVFYTIETV